MVHPALEQFVQTARDRRGPHPRTLSPAERRAAYREQALALWPAGESLASVVDAPLTLAGRTLTTRLYTPHEVADDALVVYFHGGSFVAGDLDTHDAQCRRLAADTRLRYLAVEYRLAPEHPFPAGVEDACDALRYVSAHRGEFASADAQLLAMGESAGATLIAVAAVLTRHEGLGLASQVLLYPTLGPAVLTNSSHVYGAGFLLDVDHLRYDYSQYLGETTDPTDPRVSPLFFDDLAGTPPAIILVAECDPLRDEAVAYAGLLEHFDVPVELLEGKGMLHGFLRLGGAVPEALEIVDELARHMRRSIDRATN